MVVDGNPELRTTGERRNAHHKRWQSVVGTELNVLGGPRVMATNEASRLWGNVCRLQQQSMASGVRGSRWRGNRQRGGGWVYGEWLAGQRGGQTGRGRGFRDGRDGCSNLRQRHFHSLLLRLRRKSGSHGWWANSWQWPFHSLLLSLRRTSDSHGWQANFWQRHFHSLLLSLRRTSGSHGWWANSWQRHCHSLLLLLGRI